MAKYTKCDNCGERINYGDDVYTDNDSIGIYCSERCYCNHTLYKERFTEDLAYDNNWPLWDDDERKEEIKKEMEMHKQAIEELLKEFERLTAQN